MPLIVARAGRARWLLLPGLLPCLTAGCRGPIGGAASGLGVSVQFVDVAAQAGVTFRHTSGESGRLFTAETLGSGCAFLDYDGDGRLDLLFVNSSRLPGFQGKGPFYPALYRNEGGGHFSDVTRAAGMTLDCYGMGTAIADYDNDGDPDVLITAYGGPHLFRNDHGRFTEVTRGARISRPVWGTSAAWFDYDRDGRLDLFIGSYLDWSPGRNRLCGEGRERYACDPTYYSGTVSTLYHNDGGGRFTDVTERAGVARPNGKALGVVVWDADGDGWPDFAVANDSEPNWLFHNNRNGTFTEIGVEAGVGYGPQGKIRAGMGADLADYDHSGRETLVIGNLSGEGLALFRPEAPTGGPAGSGQATGAPALQFVDRAEEAGIYQASMPFSTFGARFLDFDLDGYPDLLTANGHVHANVAHTSGSYTFAQRLQLFHNEPGEAAGSRRFRDVTAVAGADLNVPRAARGLAVGDFDGDGDPDALVSVNNGRALLLENRGTPHAHWLAVRLIGTRSNRDGIGASVRVTAGGVTQSGWVRSGGSYGSEDERVARFGLGAAVQAQTIEVRWPSEGVDRLQGVRVNQTLVVREGQTGQAPTAQ
jgi:hypothetical protein